MSSLHRVAFLEMANAHGNVTRSTTKNRQSLNEVPQQ